VSEELPEPPDDSVVGTPPRRPGSVRRTASINMVWPGADLNGGAGAYGVGGPGMQLRGRSRDLLTPQEGDPVVLAEGEMVIGVGDMRTITSVEVSPERPGAERLVGAQGGSRLRTAIDEALPGEREAATPLHFLLDDVAGASLIAGFAWSQAIPPEDRKPIERPADAPTGNFRRKGRIICSGLRPGGYNEQRIEMGDWSCHFVRLAGDLSGDDPWAWHDIEAPGLPTMRRRRRVDVWREGGAIQVDAHFRDSFWRYDMVEMALHEYTVQATVDAASRVLEAIDTQVRVLPFPECPWAAPHATDLVGLQVDSFRTSVQDTLTELHCCTHLNDMLRCLAEVASLAEALDPTLV
jgi:Protein of unknown function (DUF2889)